MVRVSFITPLHNKGAFIADTIESVRRQTISDWEMIVVENGSQDDGPAKVRELVKVDSRIQLLVAEVTGPGAARNAGIRAATGEWMLFLDADDLAQPDHAEALLRDAKGDVDLVAGCWRRFTDSPNYLLPLERPSTYGKTHAQLLDSVIAFCPWSVNAVIVRRSVLSEDFLWPEELDRFLGEDIAFWFKVLNSTSKWVNSDSCGALYRWKTADCRTQDEDPEKWFAGLHNAANANLEWLKERGQEPTAGQCESLMRLYEGLFLLARKHRNQAVAEESRNLSRHWLDLAWQRGRKGKGLLARRMMGLPVFNLFRKCTPSPD